MWDGVVIAAGTVVTLVAILAWRRLRQQARDAAERWLIQHGYHIRELGTPWMSTPNFPVTLWRDSENAFDLRAVVDDRKLGGTGVVWLRFWRDGFGNVRDEPDIWWERMPDPVSDAEPAGLPREAAQLALLSRIAAGESAFWPDDRHTAEAGERFDRLVEHVLAMQRRGLVTAATPIAELRTRGREYAAVTDVALTAEGARIVAHQSGER